MKTDAWKKKITRRDKRASIGRQQILVLKKTFIGSVYNDIKLYVNEAF